MFTSILQIICLICGSILVGINTTWQIGLAIGLIGYALMPYSPKL